MKKYGIRILTFLAIFAVLFWIAQEVLHERWYGQDNLYQKNLDHMEQPEGSIDVLCFGTSEMYNGYAPIVTYHEEGITGYNFAVNSKSAVTTYYQLLFALKYQTPKVVLCDFSSLYDDGLPADKEGLYHNVVENMPDREIKNALIDEICELDSEQSELAWHIPLLYYHGMWSSLKAENFSLSYHSDEDYPSYLKGSAFYTESGYYDELFEMTPDYWQPEEDDDENFSANSVKYYDLFIEECQKRGIQVVAVLPPKITEAEEYAARLSMKMGYFDSRGVDCLNYNCYEEVVERMDLDFDEDYKDGGHLNVRGACKFSRAIAQDLKARYDLPDRREDSLCKDDWDRAWETFESEVLAAQEDQDKS